MAGSAKTTNFMIGTATVMLGLPADLYNFKPSTHSIGLVKNFSLTSEPTYVELTQGVQNTIVDSVVTANPVRATFEVYEFSRQNLMYGLGLTGANTATVFTVNTTLSAGVTGGSSVDTCTVTSATGLAQGDVILIEVDADDALLTRKIVSISTNTLTVTPGFPTGVDVPSGATVRKVGRVDVGSKTVQPYYAAAVTGRLSDGTAILIQLPKLRIVKGFNLAFNTNDYGNLPFELSVYDLVAADSLYSDFGSVSGRIIRT